MALTFGAASSDRVVVTAAASINDLATLSVGGWIYPTALASTALATKCNGILNGWQFVLNGTGGNLRFRRDRTTDTDYQTNSAPLTTGKWYFVMAVYDAGAGAGQVVNIYVGDEAALAVEATYGVATDGAGAEVTDAAQNLEWGNNPATHAGAPSADMAQMMVYSRALSLAEVQALQFRPRMLDANCVLLHRLGDNGTGSQIDLSGNGNHGTVTGATVATRNPALGPWRKRGQLYTPWTPAASFVRPMNRSVGQAVNRGASF